MQDITRELVLEKLPRRAADTNKGSYGTVAAFAGSVSYRGAPVLAAEGALRCGAGLVFLATVPEAMQLALSRSPECCVLPCRAGGDGCLLPEDVQTIVKLRFYEELPLKEIAIMFSRGSRQLRVNPMTTAQMTISAASFPGFTFFMMPHPP